jgi:hypothetical protein
MRYYLRIAILTVFIFLLKMQIWSAPIITRHDIEDFKFVILANEISETAALFLINKTDVAGTLISPYYILTAAHVANDIKIGDSIITKNQKYMVSQILIHPKWNEDQSKDLALIKLSEKVDNIMPVPLYQKRNELDQTIVLIGNGDNGTGISGPIGNDGQLRAATNRVDEISENWLKWDFIDPRVDSAHVTEMEGISGPGDSGGPAFIYINGKAYLAGISAGQSTRNTQGREGIYGIREFYVRISSYLDWIKPYLLD